MTPESTGPQPAPARSRRDEVIQSLGRAFANDELTVEEYEKRLDVANRTRAQAELDALLADLDTAALPVPAGQGAKAPASASRPVPPLPSEVRESQTHMAIMGGVERKGQWVPARQNHIIVVMGGVGLDFREARLAPGVTEVSIFCAMGGVEIIVPPSVVVDADGVAIMGGFEHVSPRPGDPDAPVLRVTGFVAMGGVEITVRHPGETQKDAKRREREERKRLRRGQK